MKTTIQQQENNFKKWSKVILIHFSILAAMISNSAFANELPKIKTVSELHDSTFKKPALESECDTCAVTTGTYTKSIEEVIAENNKIIESVIEDNTTSAIERIIKEDNQIIESNIFNEVFPLDFKIINKSFSMLF